MTVASLMATTGCAMEAGAKPSKGTPSPPGVVRERPLPPLDDLERNTRNAIAWAPLANPDDITVEGSVPSSRAWSTSKVLVVAAYLDAVVDGDPDKIPGTFRASIRAALRESDNTAVLAIRNQIPQWNAAMTRVLRAVGDRSTKVPPSFEGTMQWSVREQVRFMAAVGNGRVVSPSASAYLLREMQPIPEQRWGLGTIGASAFKPGWMGVDAESRQMGIVGDFAVAIITAGEGATGGQSGDAAHSSQLDRLAKLLAERLDDARCVRSDLFGWRARWC